MPPSLPVPGGSALFEPPVHAAGMATPKLSANRTRFFSRIASPLSPRRKYRAAEGAAMVIC
jgi:hypothetical protein